MPYELALDLSAGILSQGLPTPLWAARAGGDAILCPVPATDNKVVLETLKL